MKLWLKYLIGIAAGLLSALVIPPNSIQSQAVLDFVVDLTLRIGRYTIVPVLFFSVAVAVYKLHEERLVLKTGAWTFGLVFASSFILMVLGLFTALVIKLPRIPITTEKITEIPVFTWENLVKKVFPFSGFESLMDGFYLLPCFIFAGLIGASAASDRNASRQAFIFFDSISKVFFNLMSFFTEILVVGIIAVMFRWTLSCIDVLKSGVYNGLLMILLGDLLFVAVVLYPLVLRLLCHDTHPYRVLYAAICPFLTAFFSGDTNFALALHYRHGKESLGIKRRTNSVTFPLFSVFGRGGSALVQSVCFVLVLRAYSSLGISVQDTLWIGGISFILSFALAEIPAGGPFLAITVMCMMYGRSFESGYLLLKSAAPIICSFAAGIDSLTAMFGSYIVAVKTKTIQHQEIKKFI